MIMLRNIPKPSISRNLVIKGAGLFWVIGGLFLIYRSYSIIPNVHKSIIVLSLIAITLSSLKSWLLFSRIVNKNIKRIENLAPNKKEICLFAFQSIESYFLIIIMIILGVYIREINLSADILFVLYLAIGLALIISSRKYLMWCNS
ncbi:MAG: hypothetical protein DRP35_02780 [Candidatus Zixiibacteriota bacterium]|nr:MAG: hypothetical protein DRP35_02780 [candidate division Zixibacteria bacterium]